MKPMLLIMNPNAGKKQGLHALPEILGIFLEGGWLPTVVYTTQPGEATRLAEEYGAGKELIVCVGGDGTFNEVLSGVVKKGLEIPLGYIPAGSTNDFAASLHLPTQPAAAARAIVTGSLHSLDAGSFNGRCFSYVASFGAFTKTSYSTPQELKNTLGHLAYVLEGVKDLSTLKATHVTIETDQGVLEEEELFGAISNATSIGGILHYDSGQVDMNDGLLEVLLIRMPKNLLEFNSILNALAVRNYEACENIHFFPARRVKIHAGMDVEWSLDGERQDPCEEILIENLPDAFRLMM